MPQAAKKRKTRSKHYRKDVQPYNFMYQRKVWKQLRKEHLQQYPLCADCLKENKSIPATDVDHIERHEGNWGLFLDSDNLQSLCKKHHSMKTYRETLASDNDPMSDK